MNIKRIVTTLFLTLSLLFSHSLMAYAITEAEVQAVGKEKATGSILIWFLCAVAFLKISQKIDSFMSSLGVNVGNTGGSMMAEMIVAARGISVTKNLGGGSFFRGGSSHMGGSPNVNNASFLSGGLAGAVSRQFTKSAVNGVTGQGGNALSRKAFESSLQNGGNFANNITSTVAQGNINHTGFMQGTQASQALSSYMGHSENSADPSYSDVEIGGGRITGTETSSEYPYGAAFGMYNADQYIRPNGNYDTITTADSQKWYRQYETDHLERTPYMTDEGKIAYREDLVKRLPDMPKRKERV